MKIGEYLKTNSGFSSMRMAMMVIVVSVALIFMSVAWYITSFSIRGIQINTWEGIGVFFGGIAGVLGVTLGAKAYQKKTESKEP